MVGSTSAWLRFDPMRWRSSLTPQFAARIGADPGTRELVRSLGVADLTAPAIPFSIQEPVAPGGGADGVLGFDLLAELRWSWTPATGALVMGTATARAEGVVFQSDLPQTHWAAVRTPIDGLGMQLMLTPRIEARPEFASVGSDPGGVMSLAAVRRAYPEATVAVGEERRMRTRVGGWDEELVYRVAPEAGSEKELPIVTRVLLGADFARRWTWRWSPVGRQLALVELPSLP